MKASDIMTTNPACCTPEQAARDVAKLMDAHHCGLIPVINDEESKLVVGVVTDRDLALRGMGRNRPAETPVSELMSRDVSCCMLDDDIEEVERIMAERQVRRVPVIDDSGAIVGIIAQADLARRAGEELSAEEVGRVVEEISEPINDERADADVGVRLDWRGDA